MDGEKLSPEKLKEVAKWPNRVGQISLLLGQILGPGGKLMSQVDSSRRQVAQPGQEGLEKEEGGEPAAS